MLVKKGTTQILFVFPYIIISIVSLLARDLISFHASMTFNCWLYQLTRTTALRDEGEINRVADEIIFKHVIYSVLFYCFPTVFSADNKQELCACLCLHFIFKSFERVY